jgi:hypothetical protein
MLTVGWVDKVVILSVAHAETTMASPMSKSAWQICLAGLVIIVIGVGCIVLSLV